LIKLKIPAEFWRLLSLEEFITAGRIGLSEKQLIWILDNQSNGPFCGHVELPTKEQ
jgi:hypothetical protein